MMVGLLLYACTIGEHSSRAIERRCREDVAFRVIIANQVPDHATIARFRVRRELNRPASIGGSALSRVRPSVAKNSVGAVPSHRRLWSTRPRART